jgi:DNA-binding MarR family transcriptional regulator
MQLVDGSGAEPTPDELAVADEVARAMTRLYRAASRAKAQDAAAGGDYHATPLMAALGDRGPLRATELADTVFTDLSTVSRQVALLVERGYVDRTPDPDDRRATRLELSERGRAVLADRLLARQHSLAAVLADWPMSQRQQLARLLDRFADDVAAHVVSAHNADQENH